MKPTGFFEINVVVIVVKRNVKIEKVFIVLSSRPLPPPWVLTVFSPKLQLFLSTTNHFITLDCTPKKVIFFFFKELGLNPIPPKQITPLKL